MSPGVSAEGGKVSKRRRVSNENGDHYSDIFKIQEGQIDGDSLSSPATSTALKAILKDRALSDVKKKKIQVILRDVKLSIDEIPRKPKKFQFDSVACRNTLRTIAKGVPFEKLFRSSDFSDLQLKFFPPSTINVVGSFLLGYTSSPIVDIAVEMPPSIFQDKDYLNYRYHDKRMLYLIYLARHFVKAEEGKWCNVSLTQKYLNGDTAKPLLSMSQVGNPDITVCVIPTCSRDVFDTSRLAENRRNVRPTGESSLVEEASDATIAYNNSILIDFSLVSNLRMLHSAVASTPVFAETVLFLEAWCIRQRLFNSKFPMAAVVADLIKNGTAPKRASMEHLLRCAFNAIRRGCLENMSLNGVRICAGLDVAMLKRAAACAGTALCLIESKSAAEDPWYGIVPYLFATARGARCTPKPLSTLFDAFIRISGGEEETWFYDGKVGEILHRAFVETGRVSSIERLDSKLFGLMISSNHDACRKVDMRPENCDAAEFKSFWGEKAILRRFKDGKVIESVVWNGGITTLSDIGKYVVNKHLGEHMTIGVVIGDLEKVAGISGQDNSSMAAMAAFDKLATLLRSLEGLPLNILAVHATSPHLRGCGAYAIRPSVMNRYIQPLEMVASFETSSAWPDDLVALSAAKAAFYVALKTKLAASGITSQATISFVDITLGGFIFRLRIRVDREKDISSGKEEDMEKLIWITETLVHHHNVIRSVRNAIMGGVARLAKRWLNTHLLLSQMGPRGEELIEVIIAGLLSRVRISKAKSVFRGFCEFLHLLAEFPWEVYPFSVYLEDEHQFVDAQREHSEESRENEMWKFNISAMKKFSQQPGPFAVYNARDEDGEAVSWFGKGNSPEFVIVSRIRETAKASLQLIEEHLASNHDGTLATVFKPPVDGFNVIIHLDTKQIPFHSHSGQGELKSRKSGVKIGSLIAGLDPVNIMVQELTHRLGRYAMFLVRHCGGSEIYVVWRPIVHKLVPFSLREAQFRKPVLDVKVTDGKKTNGALAVCEEELVAEIEHICGSLVSRIEFFKEGNGL